MAPISFYMCVRLTNLDLDFEIQFSDFAIKHEVQEGFHLRGSVLKVDCNYEVQVQISWISFFTVRLGILKRICKTVLVNSGLFSANYACVCETVVEIRTPLIINFSYIYHFIL